MEPLERYQNRALKKATVEFLGRGEGYCGKIPGFSGLIVFGDTKKEVLAELESALEGWMEIALKKGIGLPSLKDEEKQLV